MRGTIIDMEPKSPTPQLGPEQFMPGAPIPEQAQFANGGVERRPEMAHERVEARPSAQEQVQQAPQALSPMTLPPIPTPQTQAPSAFINANPIAANDDDLIEKEWVDRAKKIIAATKDDPYKRELEITKLQADYLKKRYGRVLGEAA